MTETPKLDIRELVAVAQVAELRNFKLAATRMNTTQPTLSRLITRAEKALGTVLFRRGWSGAETTAAGDLVSLHSRTALRLINEAEAEIFSGRASHPVLAAGLTMSQLQIIDAIRRTGGATAAARDLGRSQPSVSRTLTECKTHLGLHLFERRKAGLEALPAAICLSVLYVRLREVFDVIQTRVEQNRGSFSGRIAIGVLPFSSQPLIPRVFARISEAHPNVRLGVVPGTYFGLVEALRQREIEGFVGIMRGPACPTGLIEHPLLEERFTILARADNPVLQTATTVADLADQIWLVPPLGSPVRAYFENLCSVEGISPQLQTAEIQFFTATEEMIASGTAVGMTTYGTGQLRRLRPDLRQVQVPLSNNKATIAVTTLAGTERDPVFAEFLRLLGEMAEDFR